MASNTLQNRGPAEEQFRAAELFLRPAFRQTTGTVIDRLTSSIQDISFDSSQSKAEYVVEKSLTLLENIHQALATIDDDIRVTQVLHTSTSKRVTDQLLSLICLEGIYPYLLPGVGVSAGRGTSTNAHNELNGSPGKELFSQRLLATVSRLYNIVIDYSKGVSPVLAHSILSDIIASLGQLQYEPNSKNKLSVGHRVEDLIAQYGHAKFLN
jgi:hypothetical protein